MGKLIFLIFAILIIFVIAVLMQDQYGCNDEETRDRCLLTYVEKNKKTATMDICQQITNTQEKNICYFTIATYSSPANNINACKHIEEKNETVYYNQDYCLLKVAIADKNKEACNLITSESQKEICLESLDFNTGY